MSSFISPYLRKNRRFLLEVLRAQKVVGLMHAYRILVYTYTGKLPSFFFTKVEVS